MGRPVSRNIEAAMNLVSIPARSFTFSYHAGNECNSDLSPTMDNGVNCSSWLVFGKKDLRHLEPQISPHAKWSWCGSRHSHCGSPRRRSCEIALSITSKRHIRLAEYRPRQLQLRSVPIGESCGRGKWNAGLSGCLCTCWRNRSVRKC